MKKEVLYKEVLFFEVFGKKIPLQALTASAIWFFFVGLMILSYNLGMASAIEIQKSMPTYTKTLENGDTVFCGMMAKGLQLQWDCVLKPAEQTEQEKIPEWFKNLSEEYGKQH